MCFHGTNKNTCKLSIRLKMFISGSMTDTQHSAYLGDVHVPECPKCL